MTLFIFILKFSSDEFFFRWDKSGRSITPAPDKIFTQKFFQGIEEGRNCGYRKWSKPLPSHNFNLPLCPEKTFG